MRLGKYLLLVIIIPLFICAPSHWGRDGSWGRSDVKFGQAGGVSTWSTRMLNSYKSIHVTLPDGGEEELLARLQPNTYLYNTFGPAGQNKTVCDFVLLFKFDGTIATRGWTKAGNALRWNFDGVIEAEGGDTNDLPRHTFTAGDAGILTVSTTDGWTGLITASFFTNPFTDRFPNLTNAGVTSLTQLQIQATSLEGDMSIFSGLTSLSYFRFNQSAVSGDFADLSPLTGLTTLLGYINNVSDVSGAFVNAGLTTINISDNSLSQAEVDQVLADYVAVHNDVGLDLSKDYIINLSGTNAAPSSSGIADYKTLVNLFTGQTGSMTITTSGTGANLMSGWDLQTWGKSAGVITTATSFETISAWQNIYKSILITGKTYLIHIDGNITVGNLYIGGNSPTQYEITSGSFDLTFVFTATHPLFVLQAGTSGAITTLTGVTGIQIYQLD